VNLARTLGLLRILPLKGLSSGFQMAENSAISSSADQARNGIYVPAGRYTLQFYESVIADPARVSIAAGDERVMNLNRLYARVIVPATKGDSTIEYTWREGNQVRTLSTSTKQQIAYILAGTYRLQASDGSTTRVTTLVARPSHSVRLPDTV
jgi:hypothetical protein